jgi:hypothetical protein
LRIPLRLVSYRTVRLDERYRHATSIVHGVAIRARPFTNGTEIQVFLYPE